MITTIQIRPVSGTNVTINDAIYPVEEWEPEPDLPEASVKKMQAVGVWPSFAYPGSMTITCNGHILGSGASDAARASDVMAKRRALMDACLPVLNAVQGTRKHGDLRVRYDDMTEDADAEFHCVLFRAPLAALQGTNIPFFINFFCFTPYFVGTSTQTLYLP